MNATNPLPLIDGTILDEIRMFISDSLDGWIADAIAYGCFDDKESEYYGMQLTIACSDDGTKWNYQTGDNSYTGNAYGLPHWAVVYIYPDSTTDELMNEIINQLEDLLTQ